MYEQTNTMMETKTSFQIPQLLDGDNFTSEDLADDMEGLRLSFTRIKIPGGGHLQFEIPSGNPDVPDYAPYLEGVILYSHNSNAYWPEGSEYDDDQPPLCQSFDGKVGYGEPGGTCADCVLNQFGSDGNNKGKACKNMRMLYLLRSGEYMPIQIALPPTSLTPYTRFVNEAFLSRRRKVCTGVVRIGLKKAVSGSHEYCVATFTKIADFAGEDLAHIRAYADGFVAQIKDINAQRAQAGAAASNIIGDSVKIADCRNIVILPDLQLLFQKKSIDQGVVLSGKAALRFGQRDGNRGLRRRPCFPFFFLNAGDRIRREVLPVLHQ